MSRELICPVSLVHTVVPFPRLGMSRVVIVVDSQIEERGKLVEAFPTMVQMVNAIKDAISWHSSTSVAVTAISSSDLTDGLLHPSQGDNLTAEDIIWCPLTLDVPNFRSVAFIDKRGSNSHLLK